MPELDEPISLPPHTPTPAGLPRPPSLVVRPDAASAAAEQYRLLAQRLEALLGRGSRRIGFTSPSRGEGRTTTAVNVALALARGRRHRVVLVDCDLRAPAVHATLGLPPGAGLTDVLAGTVPLDDALLRAGDDPIDVLHAGSPASPSAAIASPRLADLLRDLARTFDAVVVDAPAVLPLADVPTLAQCLDGLVLVLRAGRTRREHLRLAAAALPADRLIGCVLQRAGPEAGTPYRLMAAHDRTLRPSPGQRRRGAPGA